MLYLSIRLDDCNSLKEKRSRLAPLIHQVHRKFNISIAETDDQDIWRKASLTCALASNDRLHIERSFQALIQFIQSRWPDEEIVQQEIEIV